MRNTIMFIIIILSSFSAQALSVFLNPEQQMFDSDMIAVVDIKDVEVGNGIQTHTNRTFFGMIRTITTIWSSDAEVQRANVVLVRALKGNPDKEFKIVDDKRQACLHPEFKEGRYLVFLRRDAGDVILTNGQYSLRRIHDEVVEWYKRHNDKILFFERPILEVIQEIQAMSNSLTNSLPDKTDGVVVPDSDGEKSMENDTELRMDGRSGGLVREDF